MAQASLLIDILVVGGGIAGLASAYAFSRVGHRVTVLERGIGFNNEFPGGLRLPPNMSKILNQWGLEAEVGKIAAHSEAITFLDSENGELLGRHTWNQELIRESRGHFNVTPHAGMIRFLQCLAKSSGADIRFNTHIRSIDPNSRKVTLTSGEVLYPDVIVGADGAQGCTRSHLLSGPEREEIKYIMYSTTVPKKLMKKDPDLAYFFEQSCIRQYCWFGGPVHVMAYQMGATDGTDDFAMYIYCPPEGHEITTTWERSSSREKMLAAMAGCEPRLRKLARMGTRPNCIPITDAPVLDRWVHDSGRMVVIGDAAHPTRPGGVQTSAMAFEDGVVLGKLFSHLRTEDQISTFLWAFEELRQTRCKDVKDDEMNQLKFSTLPSGYERAIRDEDLKEKERQGRNVLEPPDDGDDTTGERWGRAKFLFDYDAEDAADNWWVEWGLLRERSKGVAVSPPRMNVTSQIVNRAYATRYRRL